MIYDKRDSFNFPIVNFPFMKSNIPSRPAYGVYISQLVTFGRIFIKRNRSITTRLIRQGFFIRQSIPVSRLFQIMG